MNKAFFKHFQIIFLIFIIFLNLGTFFFTAPLSQNLSDLGNALGHKFYLIIWGFSSALYFFIYTFKFMKKNRYPYRLGYLILLLSCIFMAASVCIPYDPFHAPFFSKWHTQLAMIGTSAYVLLFYHILTTIMKKDIFLFQYCMRSYTILVVCDLLLYLLNSGVSTLLETSFTITMSFLLYQYIKKE